MSPISTDIKWSMVPDWVSDWEKSGLSHAAVRLYAILWRFANTEGEGAIPSRALLARRMGLKTTDRVDVAKRELVEAGALEVFARRAEGRQTTNEYRLHQRPKTGPRKLDSEPEQGRENQGRENSTHNDKTFLEREVSGTDVPETRQRLRDELWDALVRAMGTAAPVTSSGRGAWNRALRELREAGASPQQIEAAAVDYRKQWPGISITPNALAKHWHTFALEVEGRAPLDVALRWAVSTGRLIAPEDRADLIPHRSKLSDEERARVLLACERRAA